MGGLDGCRGGGGRLSLVVLVSEQPYLVSEMSGKFLFICGAGNPVNVVSLGGNKYNACLDSLYYGKSKRVMF